MPAGLRAPVHREGAQRGRDRGDDPDPGGGRGAGRRLRVGIVAPPWVPVPPVRYGGTEGFVDVLARGLQARGHEVRLFASGDSTCPVERSWLFAAPPEPMGLAVLEAAHVRAAYAALTDCDLVHDNTAVGPVWAAAVRHRAPVVVTYHGCFIPETETLWAEVGRWTTLVAISRSQRESAPGVPFAAVVHHGVEPERYPCGDGSGGYLAFLGRLAPYKGAKAAIEIAQRAGVPLQIAAKMREQGEREYFAEHVEPRLGPGVEYLGEVGPEDRARLLAGAVALLNPIAWAEPFGLVMIEALACGTPVVGYPGGAAPEIVRHGVTGFLVDGVDEAVAALGRLSQIDRSACRRDVEERFSAGRMVAGYERVYRQVLHEDAKEEA